MENFYAKDPERRRARRIEAGVEYRPEVDVEREPISCDQLLSVLTNDTQADSLNSYLEEVFESWGQVCRWLLSPNTRLANFAPAVFVMANSYGVVIWTLKDEFSLEDHN